MADEESESGAGSKDSGGQSTSFGDKETPSAFTSVPIPAQAELEIWNSSASFSPRPRSLCLKRSSPENGFGFTLRHFIVYPPETNAILARDRHLGVSCHVVGNEPMDTIFVKNVRENSPASASGLTTGDRILSVNGEDIAGLSYAKIIQLIHRTGNLLHLLVVPKENDLLQLYFSDTAHNPETNQRLRVHSPESSITNSSIHSKKSGVNGKVSNSMHPYMKSETTPSLGSMSSSIERERERLISPGRVISARRSSEGNNERKTDLPMSVCSRRMRDIYASPQTISDASSCGSNESGRCYGLAGPAVTCRFSLDAGVGRHNYYDSLSDSSIKDSYGSEDSLIMSRLRKSFEQKEEFLNRPVQPTASVNQKEFYSRPQKLTVPSWPPVLPAPVANESKTLDQAPVDLATAKARSKQNFISTLDKIQENAPPISRSASETLAIQPFQVVSVRAKQFEKGAPVQDKTELYRSELARLTTRHNVANVAERRRDYENRAQMERQSFAARETRSLESAHISTIYSTPGSGNRTIPIGSRHLHCIPPADFTLSNAELKSDDLLAQKNKPVVRQESYLAACSKPTITITRKAESGDNLATVSEHGIFEKADKNTGLDDDKSTRRISYIKATATGDCLNLDSEYELSDSEVAAVLPPQRRSTRRWRAPLFPGDIQRLRRFFEDLAATSGERGILGSRKTTESFPDQDQHSVTKDGAVLCKVTQVEGKRAGDRSWKAIWLTLRGPFLYLCKERKESATSVQGETPATFDRPDLGASCDRIDIRCSIVEVACDYTKRKHVFRVNAPSVGAELLLQAEDATSLTQWVNVLQEQTLTPANSNDPLSNIGSNTSPSSGSKTFRKFTSLRNRSPTAPCSESPSNKAKKLVQNEAQQTSPKSRTWKNKMAKQFRRIQPGSSSLNTQSGSTYPAGATIGIPLEFCPSCSFSEYVPLLVEICTSIVEAKGLEIIGIYRVPGNNAAVSSLTDAVNRGLDYTTLEQDSRWKDVNVISSLLKSFFRKLPDALLTSELYPHFIQADRIEDPIIRMVTLRKLIHDLPDHNFETLRHLLFHLKKVVDNSSINKMEARNLAIVFGPTLVRNGDDMVTMVTDMSHQCRIVESLICHVDWCFGDGDLVELKASIPDMNSVPELDATSSNHGVLLENIRKVEASIQSPVTAKDIVSTIIGAANRKKQKTSSKHHASSSRKSHSLNTTVTHIGSSSEDILSDNHNFQNSSKTKNGEKKDEEKKAENESMSSETSNSVTCVKIKSDEVDNKIQQINIGNNWTYANLAASTQERIKRFEQETKAMLQRELTRQKRSSECTYDDLNKERASIKSKDETSGKQAKQLTSSLLSNKSTEIKKNEIAAISTNDHSVCDNTPPVIVMRRNLPNLNGGNVTINNDSNSNNSDNNSNNLKRLKTNQEFVQNNSMNRSGSLDSLNRVDRPSSHVSDDGDLLMSLTSTFDQKLKSLNEEEDDVKSEPDGNTAIKKRASFNCRSLEDSSLFRDPSLHRTYEKSSKMIELQNEDLEHDKENSEKEKIEDKDVKEKRSCVTCGCSLKLSEGVQQHCDNPKRSVLQETRPENRLQENVRREPKLFYSNSVKLRRSELLKEDNGDGTKLRRSGSLNKHEPKFTKFESWMLTKNAESSKLKRSDSLSKSEKTESNMAKRRQMEMSKKVRSEKEGKMKRRNTSKNSIKRRHTVGGTKDFDKVSWLQNQQRDSNKENRKERRTSSPDLSSTRMTDFFIEVVVRPRSIISVDRNFISRLLNIPLESQV